MRLSVIGCGYLGAVHAASMAELGHQVVGIDVDPMKVSLLRSGKCPFYEPGFSDLLSRNVESGRLTFSTDFSAIEGAQVHFIGVGTPQAKSGAADMSYVNAAISSMRPFLGKHIGGPELVVGKSTVPVGTAETLAKQLESRGITLVWNPEFLREGFAVKDTLEPDRMVYGLPDDTEKADSAQQVLDSVYKQIIELGTPRLVMDYATAELVKVSANAFLATKISFINAMAQICDAAGGDVTALAESIGLDNRIGHRFLRAGIGFGGGCLPKDIRAFQARAKEMGIGDSLAFLAEVDRINDSVKRYVLDIARDVLKYEAAQSRVAILGAAFKPNSDDIRNSPSLDLAAELSKIVGRVVVHDPEAGKVLARKDDLPFEIATTIENAFENADLVILGTEWKQYVAYDPEKAAVLVNRRIIIDGRNALDRVGWKKAGWQYYGIGRR